MWEPEIEIFLVATSKVLSSKHPPLSGGYTGRITLHFGYRNLPPERKIT
jgi:hypothetical protein